MGFKFNQLKIYGGEQNVGWWISKLRGGNLGNHIIKNKIKRQKMRGEEGKLPEDGGWRMEDGG